MGAMTPDATPPEGSDHLRIDRRALLGGGISVAIAAILAACSRGGNSDQTAAGGEVTATTEPASQTGQSPATSIASSGTTVALTPECKEADDATPALTEGPYFKPSSPEKTNLYADGPAGTKLVLTGTVVTTACQPVSRALVDFWQADGSGEYDNTTYRFRGHQFTDAQGRYRVETVLPGLYPGRTRHIHVKVQAPNGPILTTQLFFPGEARNASDSIYRKDCEIDIRDGANGKDGTFRFAVRT
jgi:protocatechuate 3,4-dioxygenase beta subunit